MKPQDIRITRLKTAKAEAERFIRAADKAVEHLESDEFIYQSPPFAAAKRAAIDTAAAMHQINKPIS